MSDDATNEKRKYGIDHPKHIVEHIFSMLLFKHKGSYSLMECGMLHINHKHNSSFTNMDATFYVYNPLYAYFALL